MLSLLFGKPVALEALKWKLHSFHLWLPWQTLVCTHQLVLTQTLYNHSESVKTLDSFFLPFNLHHYLLI